MKLNQFIILETNRIAKITSIGRKYLHVTFFNRKSIHDEWNWWSSIEHEKGKILKDDAMKYPIQDNMPDRILTDAEKIWEARRIELNEFAKTLPEPPEISDDGFMNKSTYKYRNGFFDRISEKYLGKNPHIYTISKYRPEDEVSVEGLNASTDKFSGISYCYAELISEYAYQTGVREGVRMYLHRTETVLDNLISELIAHIQVLDQTSRNLVQKRETDPKKLLSELDDVLKAMYASKNELNDLSKEQMKLFGL